MTCKTAESIKKLAAAVFDEDVAKHPNIPIYAIPRPKFDDRTANGLTKCIIAYIQTKGGQAERINTTGTPIVERGENGRRLVSWRYGNTTKGSADISATIKGLSVKIEVKIGRDRQSSHQRKYQQEVERAGGLYYIARNFADFVKWYEEKFM